MKGLTKMTAGLMVALIVSGCGTIASRQAGTTEITATAYEDGTVEITIEGTTATQAADKAVEAAINADAAVSAASGGDADTEKK